ncbi:MAG: glycosyltransferase family 2 protein [Bacteroidetes bacterium]|nr:glycosyltransferase family 2 protein [Bacteroidota bacterium]
MEVSIVIPLFNEEELVSILYERTISALTKITDDFEIVFVDDGGTDNTLNNLLTIRKTDSRVKVLELSRNFGHQAAYTAGLNVAKGAYVVMLDGDLQDPPEVIQKMYAKIKEEDFDIIYGKRTDRHENIAKKLTIKIFHYVFNRMNRLHAPADVGNFSVISRPALDAFLRLNEKNRYLPGLRYYIGFKQGCIEYERPERFSGRPKMGFLKLLRLASDAVFSFSKLPIRLSLLIGTIGILLSLTGAGIVFYKKITGVAITGWTSTMLGMFFFGSVQLFFLGILGEYVFRIFIETKDRPVYFIRKFYE